GVVVGMTDESPPVEAKEVLEVLDEEPVVDRPMLELTRWIADYYLTSWGEALHAALPLALGRRSRRSAVWAGGGEGEAPEGIDLRVAEEVRRRKTVPVRALARRLGESPARVEGALRRLEAAGHLKVQAVLAEPGARSRTETWVEVLPEGCRDEALDSLRKNAVRQRECLLLREKRRLRRSVLFRFGNAAEALEKKGFARKVEEEVVRIADYSIPEPVGPDPPLTPEQREALRPVEEAVRAGRFEAHLLYGITGSGKTEVYLRASSVARSLGRSVLVLVPEISLTPQTVGRFRARFGGEVVVLHSALSAGERHDTWREIHRGRFPVVVGVRSALFAPLPKLGLIVVDEEHDASYKQGEAPRYHGRDGAVVRARLEGVPVLLGSATPSVESFWNAEIGKYRLSVLPYRIENRPLPAITIVDLHLVPRKERRGVLSPLLVEKVGAVLERGDQAMIFLNRRGYASFLRCPDCGYVPRCTHCEVSFTYHSREAVLRCHYCGTERIAPDACPSCAGTRIGHRGVGTQRVEEDLAALFPSARIARMDLDTTRRKDSARAILGDFAAGKVDLLIGTQMIAKGHHFPGVSLVGVVNADTALHLPDFRAAERTFQVLLQVAGRAGRGEREGEVVIQTFHPMNYVLRAAALHEYEPFARRELEDRRVLHYPPYSRILALTFRGKRGKTVLSAAARFREGLIGDKRIAPLVWEVLGPAPAPIAKIRDRVRWRILIKGRPERWRTLREILAERLEEARKRPGPRAEIIVDVDAYDL
ncbi:MAG: primosomal protein N', partial [Candidatus Eisenbacteria bacterium]